MTVVICVVCTCECSSRVRATVMSQVLAMLHPIWLLPHRLDMLSLSLVSLSMLYKVFCCS